MTKINRNALAAALTNALKAAVNSPDLCQIHAVHEICDHEGTDPERLADLIRRDPVDFILVAAPGFSRALKLATGRNRDEWAELIS